MEQMILEPRQEDLDPSIRTMRQKKLRQRIGTQSAGQIVSRSGKRFHYIPIYPQFDSDSHGSEIVDFKSYKNKR